MSDDPPSLFEQIESPIYNDVIKRWVGRGELDYEIYLRTPKLLSLQFTSSERVADDELLFQIVHQTQELWLKLISHEIVRAIDALRSGEVWLVSQLLQRCVRTAHCLVEEMSIIETLSPERYQKIRNFLGNGSGQESPGYNAIRLASGAMREAIQSIVEEKQTSVLDIYKTKEHAEIRHFFEQCLDFDQALQMWLVRHFMLVRRTIGVDTKVHALDGLPSRVLIGRMTKPFFPELWDARVEMTTAWKREGGRHPRDRWAERDAADRHEPEEPTGTP